MRRRYVKPEISVLEAYAECEMHDVSGVKVYDPNGNLIDRIEEEEGMPSDDEEETYTLSAAYSVWD